MPEYDNTRIIETLEAGSVDTDSANVTNDVTAGSVDTDSANVTNDVTAGSVDTDEADIGKLTSDLDLSDFGIRETTTGAGSPTKSPKITMTAHRLSDTNDTAIHPDKSEPNAIAFIINDLDPSTAIFSLNGANGALEIADPASVYSTTEDNQGTTNIYYDSTNSQMEIENERGFGDQQYTIAFLEVD